MLGLYRLSELCICVLLHFLYFCCQVCVLWW